VARPIDTDIDAPGSYRGSRARDFKRGAASARAPHHFPATEMRLPGSAIAPRRQTSLGGQLPVTAETRESDYPTDSKLPWAATARCLCDAAWSRREACAAGDADQAA
jgi:hypothetical protein